MDDVQDAQTEVIVSAYVDGEAKEEEAEWLLREAAADPSVESILQETAKLKSLLGSLGTPVASADEWQSVGAFVSEAVARDGRRLRLQRLAGVAAGIVLVCAVALGAVLVGIDGPTGSPATSPAREAALPASTTHEGPSGPAPRAVPTTAGPNAAAASTLPSMFRALLPNAGHGSGSPSSTTTSSTTTSTSTTLPIVVPAR